MSIDFYLIPFCTSQIGIVLNGTTVDYTVVGGPAHSSKKIASGDTILQIDGVSVSSDTVRGYLVGNDVPGSLVTITVAKGGPKVHFSHLFVNKPHDSPSFCRARWWRCRSSAWQPKHSGIGEGCLSSSRQSRSAARRTPPHPIPFRPSNQRSRQSCGRDFTALRVGRSTE